MQNIEIKVELKDVELARLIVRRVGARRIGLLHQVDTYFNVPDCRLKKREAMMNGHPEPVEVIRYERADRPAARASSFTIYNEQEAGYRFGTLGLPIRTIVEKTRELWMIDSLRIHLDDVRHLGRFLEIEALVTPRQNVARCHARIAHLRRHLEPALGEPIATSYCDLLESDGRRPVEPTQP
ncbi:MAG: CYTH domain-containing protein [Leptolyngbya sp. PLA3]|nr:CYTH domain-containing protein [Leptolyngbya sp. PL-A3]